MITTLETERLILRKPDHRDLDAFIAFYGSERARYVGGPEDPAKAWRRFACVVGHWDLHGFGMFAVQPKTSTQAVGSIGGWYPGGWPEQEIGWLIWSEAVEGTGIAYEAAKVVQAHVFHDLGWANAVSYIDPANARSCALAERLGAQLDPDARAPHDMGPDECLVYRHPKPERGVWA
ncbi:MAG: GNAT family N-acetyltransferase [Pseudomonadota bacterium]